MEAYPPYAMSNVVVAEMSPIGAGSVAHPMGSDPRLPWHQWWVADQSPYHGVKVAGDYITTDAAQDNLAISGFTLTQAINPSDAWNSLNSPREYILPLSNPTPVGSRGSSSLAESCCDSGSIQTEDRKRKRLPYERTTRKPSKLSCSQKELVSTSQGHQTNTRSGKDGRKPNSAHPKVRKVSSANNVATLASAHQKGEQTRRIKERNRIASNNFRVKKMEDAKRLKSEEENMERINRNLSSCVADLTLEVYNLKMELLQHTSCNCALIQSYIAKEAHHYIQDLEEDNNKIWTPCMLYSK